MQAYTTVSTRHRSFGLAPVSAHTKYPAQRSMPQPQPNGQPKTEWSPEIREYVAKCFSSEYQIPGITTEQVQARLKIMINETASRNALGTTSWSTTPLPQQLIQNERMAAVTVPPPNSFEIQSSIPLAGFVPTIPQVAPQPPTNLSTPKKRKSSEISRDDKHETTTQIPPWRQPKPQNLFEDRLTYPSQPPGKRADKRQRKTKDSSNTLDLSRSSTELERRKHRFENGKNPLDSPAFNSSRDDTPMSDAPDGPVIGTCQELEKKYFRLTAPPKPETVRPLPVLERTLELLKKKWKTEQNYSYICDQFKSLRQDLTVQHIKTEFTVKVYELHARIALEKGDLGEYNQCQTQLRALYKQNLGGHPAEFLAYRILYFVYTGNRTDMNDVLADLTLKDRKEHAVKHALEVRSALALGNYHRFFRRFLDAPGMGAYLIDMFVVRERLAALANISRAYKSELKISFLTEELGFDSDEQAAAFVCDHGGQALLESRDGNVYFDPRKDGPVFEQAKRAAFSRVDIRGQI